QHGEDRRGSVDVASLFHFSPEELVAIQLSLKVAAWAVMTSLPVGVAVALLLLFGRNGPLGRLLAESIGLVFAFRWTGAALASAVMAFPLMVRAIRLS